MHHQRSKNIDTRHHFIRERLTMKQMLLEYVNTKDNVAAVLTKNVRPEILRTLIELLGVKQIE